MTTIHLGATSWLFDAARPLGRAGGFGAVFQGASPTNEPVAIKRLHPDSGASAVRELSISGTFIGRRLQHVMPVLAAGYDASTDASYVVMPVAERSLQELLDDEGRVTEAHAVTLLLQIARGLVEAIDFVHRDLKPGNVLLFSGAWRIADFGISRTAAAETATDTLKQAWTPLYASPEQWRLERATHASDIYALGCIAHALVNGQPPFIGTWDEVARQHLTAPPPRMPSVSKEFHVVVDMMLRKLPEARPTAERIIRAFSSISERTGTKETPFAALGVAAARREHEKAREYSDHKRFEDQAASREALGISARQILRGIFADVVEHVLLHAPNAEVANTDYESELAVGDAKVVLAFFRDLPTTPIGPGPVWEILDGAEITVMAGQSLFRHTTLWYARRSGADSFRWFELASGGSTRVSAATPIDDEDAPSFVMRWAEVLAKACAL